MKAVITESTHFNREVEVEPIAAQPGSYRLQFSSQLRSARNPDQWQRNFDLILQEERVAQAQDIAGGRALSLGGTESSTGDLFQIALPALSANARNRRNDMTNELIPASQVRDASDTARIQRILLVTARYFGIDPLPSLTVAQGGRP